MIDQLIINISTSSITDFFRSKLNNYKPEIEELEFQKDAHSEKFESLQIEGRAEMEGGNLFSDLIVVSCYSPTELTTRSSKLLQYEIAKGVLKYENSDGGVFIFHDEKGNFRFSFIRTNFLGTKRDFTNYKRYTYFIDPYKSNKTFKIQMEKASFGSIDRILKTFSLEAVTEEFYNEFTPKFSTLANSVVGTDKTNIKEDFALLFCVRIIFLGFVQKRKWLGEDEEFLQELLKEYTNQDLTDEFYLKWLDPLIFEALNSAPGKHVKYNNNNFSEKTKVNLQMAPYLNGELFKRKDGLDNHGFFIPDEALVEFFEFLFQYNFTVEENTNYDEELELNPEFLGIIFEKIVNKADGAVYTPRTEVDFMCRLTLVKWLEKVSQSDRNDLYYLFFPEEGTEADQKYGDFSSNQLEDLIVLLQNVTTCDPSSGSGAFPVGMMQVLNEILADLQSRDKTPEHLRTADSFERKKAIIAKSLFGVEVKHWAVWINQLRLWLSLFVDIPEEKNDEFKLSVDSLLPNLAFKIRQGDSVMQRIGEQLFPVDRHVAGQSLATKRMITKLKKDKIDFFYNKSSNEKQIRQDERRVFEQILNEQINGLKKQVKSINPETTTQTALFGLSKKKEINIFEDQRVSLNDKIIELLKEKAALKHERPLIWSIEFADVFHEKGGFDIIIGNPPYVRQEEIGDPMGKIKNKEYKSLLAETMRLEYPNHFLKKEKIDGKSDLYTYFYLKSLKLLNKDGVHTFICSNSWLDVGYGVWMQKFLLNYCQTHFIIDNHAKRSFANADVNTVITIMDAPARNKRQFDLDQKYKFVAFKKPFEECILSNYLLAIEKENHKVLSNDIYRSYPISVSELMDKGSEYTGGREAELKEGKYIGDKWGGKYLRAPDIYSIILKKGIDIFEKLGKVGKVKRGITSGCNDFFYLDKTVQSSFDIEPEYLKPLIKSSKESHSVSLKNIEFKYLVFCCSDTMKDLKGTNALKYIEDGENREIEIKQGENKGETIKGYHNITSLRVRNKWYELKRDTIADGILPCSFGEYFRFFINDISILADKRLYEFYGDTRHLNFMNSTVYPLFLEVGSRNGLGDGLMDLTVEEYKQTFVLQDPVNEQLDDRKILSIFEECGIDPKSETPISKQAPRPLPDRKVLDDAVFDAIGLDDDERKEVYRAVCQLVWNRVNKAKSV